MKMKTIISKKNTIYNKVHLMKKNNGTEENDEKYTNHEYILYIHVFLTEKIMVFLIKKIQLEKEDNKKCINRNGFIPSKEIYTKNIEIEEEKKILLIVNSKNIQQSCEKLVIIDAIIADREKLA